MLADDANASSAPAALYDPAVASSSDTDSGSPEIPPPAEPPKSISSFFIDAEAPGCSSDDLPETYKGPQTCQNKLTSASKFLSRSGWLIACALLDPGAVEGALQAGAFAGYSLLWVTLWTTLMVFAFQNCAAKIGVVTGKSLAHLFRDEYQSRYLSFVVWAALEVSVIGDDLQALIGCILALNLLFNLPFYGGAIVALFSTLLLTIFFYRAPSIVEGVVGLMMLAMLVMYFVNVVYAAPPAASVFYGLVVPQAPSYVVFQLVGTIGGIITPSTLFLGSQLVLIKPVDRKNETNISVWTRFVRAELGVGFLVSFLCNVFVVTTFAVSFFNEECAEQGLALVQGNCTSIGLEDAPDALMQLYGNAAKYMFAVALFFSGQNSMISATLAGQATFEGFLDRKISIWTRLFVTRIISLAPTLAIAFSAGTNQDTYSTANAWVNIIISLIMPFAMIPTVHISANAKYMGKFASDTKTSLFMNLVVCTLIAINFYLLFGFLYDPETFDSVGSFPQTPSFYSFIGIVIFVYAVLLFQVATPSLRAGWKCIAPLLGP